ncbi:MAG: type II toxin-antitoxin system VapC family toxin [Treponema sp.]|nr:type II toxin-antitoxin system VapC family toxin [Treponema sp.]MCL2250549.1 type II toxin-antitoxin system VapC family toxin [Treponema sp.]
MIKFLIDTNILIWYFWGSKRIDSIKEIIASENSDIYFSEVSLWEIMIKIRAEKLNIDIDELLFFAKKHAFIELPVSSKFNKVYMELAKHHKDPFDHMLLAQAITCPMHFITGDALLADYSSLVMVI